MFVYRALIGSTWRAVIGSRHQQAASEPAVSLRLWGGIR